MFIGIDANAAALRELSGRAARAGTFNLLYVRAAVEALPHELDGIADQLTVILPWGSLLAAVTQPSVPALASLRALCQPKAALTVVFGIDPARDHAEAIRLGLPSFDAAFFEGPLAAGYANAGFTVKAVRPLTAGELARWPSTWAKRLAHGQPRPVFQIDARAMASSPIPAPAADPASGR